MDILIVGAAIAVLVALVAAAKVNPFLAFLAVSIGMAIALGVPSAEVPALVQKGLGSILGGLTIVIAAGAMLGRLVVDSGAAQRIATTLVSLFGTSRIGWAMAATGFIVGIPLFYNVGFVLLVPIVFAISGRFGLPAVAVGVPALAALSVAHGLLPPHPAPTGLVKQFDASLGTTLLYGTIVAVPALVLAGPVFARFLRRIEARPLAGLAAREMPEAQLPGIWTSLFTSLLPAVLLVGSTAVEIAAPQAAAAMPWLRFVAHPDIVMLLTLAVAAVTLGTARGRPLADVMGTYGAALTDVGPVLLVVAGAGPFKEVLISTGVDKQIAAAFDGLALDPLLLAWLVTVAIRVCVGSATVAGLTAASILAPLVADPARGVDPNLMVLAVGSGSLACSHVNDAGFWLFKEYFNASLVDTFRCWTAMETIVSVVGLVGVLLLARIV
jgi:Gnt-I system high-affinity gluconate transporter